MDAQVWTKRYVIWSSANWAAFIAMVAFLTAGPPAIVREPLIMALLVALAVVSVAGQFIAAYRLVAVQDEFVRALTLKQGLWAAGLTITLAVGWGLAEQFLTAPRVPLWLVYPLFWGMYGVVSPFVRTSRA